MRLRALARGTSFAWSYVGYMFDVIVPSTLALLVALTPTLALTGPPGAASTPTTTTAEEFAAPSEPTIRDFARGEIEHPNGRLSRWVSVSYGLSTGQEAQVFVEVDTLGIG